MPQQSTVNRPALEAWQAQILRLTAFPSPAAQVTEPSWWTDLVGQPPETRTLQPKRGGQHEEGRFEGRKLVLRVEPTRIDWLFTPIDDGEEGEIFSTIGTFPESLTAFLRLMFHWFEIETCPLVQRLAFGAILLQPVEDRQAGYRLVSTYLPSVQLDAEGSSDFLYQINRPRNSDSGITALRVNRLSKWSVAARRRAEFSLGPGGVGYFPGQEHFACCLELDINTVADFQGELHREQLPRIFEELVELGKEIAAEGDIP